LTDRDGRPPRTDVRETRWQALSAKDFDVIIVGAGLAGLVAATDLDRAGVTVHILEARGRVGGRVLSVELDNEVTIDLGGQWVSPAHHRLLNRARQVGVDLVGNAAAGRSSIFVGNSEYRMGLVPAIPILPRLDLIQVGLRLARMTRTLPIDAPWAAARAGYWDSFNAEQWLRRHAHTRVGNDVIRTLARVSFAFDLEQTSLLGLLFDIRAAGTLQETLQSQAQFIRQGAQAVALRLAGGMRSRVALQRPVQAILQDNDSVTVVASGSRYRCRRVAICVPPTVIRRIRFDPVLPQSTSRLLAGLRPGNAIKAVMLYDEPFWRRAGRSGHSLHTQSAITATYDVTPPGSSIALLAVLSTGADAERLRITSKDEQLTLITDAVARRFGPGPKPLSLHMQDWTQEEWTGGCYAAHFYPGIWTSVGKSLGLPFGRVFWGGTETALKWHGYMEGAVRSGERVALDLVRSLS
jgi:monoamine oxidase